LLPVGEIYAAIEWPILVMIGAMIPVGEAVAKTGTADLIANELSRVAPVLPPAPAVLVMGPIAASLAQKLGYHMDPFLMAVAVGAGSDFLSPIGHQCNTLVLGPGGYRFGDYWRLGLPLSMIVLVVGVPLIMLFWPLR